MCSKKIQQSADISENIRTDVFQCKTFSAVIKPCGQFLLHNRTQYLFEYIHKYENRLLTDGKEHQRCFYTQQIWFKTHVCDSVSATFIYLAVNH